jgi:hypothetical protein
MPLGLLLDRKKKETAYMCKISQPYKSCRKISGIKKPSR